MIKKIIKRYREAIKRQVVTECEARVGELRGEMSEGEFLARWAEG